MTTLLAYLQLCRLPTVFTAMADIFLGFLLVHRSLTATPDGSLREFLLLLLSSSCLYLAGMVWNDIFDRRQDAEERPQRPLPSGRVSLRGAIGLGTVLLLCGIGAAFLVGTYSGIVAGLLAACILAYDGILKRTWLGPLAMGGCRFLNVILGASSGWLRFEQLWWRPQIWVAAGLGLYIVGVTWFARTEARQSRRLPLVLAMLTVNLGLATLIGWIVNWAGHDRDAVLMVLAVIVLTINRRLSAAVFNPAPELVQNAIRTMLLSIIMLDATLIYFKLGPAGAGLAVITAALILPALFLGRWLRLT